MLPREARQAVLQLWQDHHRILCERGRRQAVAPCLLPREERHAVRRLCWGDFSWELVPDDWEDQVRHRAAALAPGVPRRKISPGTLHRLRRSPIRRIHSGGQRARPEAVAQQLLRGAAGPCNNYRDVVHCRHRQPDRSKKPASAAHHLCAAACRYLAATAACCRPPTWRIRCYFNSRKQPSCGAAWRCGSGRGGTARLVSTRAAGGVDC